MTPRAVGVNPVPGPFLRVNSLMPLSRANGPGDRAVIWLQGCSLGCQGCFNPEMRPMVGGRSVPVRELGRWLAGLGDSVEGVTVSGGEPLLQRGPVLDLLRWVRRETRLSALLFTGHTLEEVTAMPEAPVLLASVDVLIAGRYDASRRLARGLRGSDNKTMHLLTDRYTRDDLEAVPAGEVVIGAGGEVIVSGIDPVVFVSPD